MALPILVALGLIFASRRLVSGRSGQGCISEASRRGALVLLFVGALVYSLALILTLSRAALVGLVIALAVIGAGAVLRRRRGDRWMAPVVWRTLAVVGAVMVLSGAVVFLTQPMFRLRLTTENDRNWYRASLDAPALPALSAREVVTVPVTLVNNGQMPWPSSGVLPINVSYHWMSATQDVYLVFEGIRTPLP